MRIYIVDCDRNSRTELKTMIEDGGMGTVAGIASRWEEAYLELQEMCPDMILADLTLSAPKTIAYIQKIREVLPQTSVVILSHVNDMDIIRMAYEKGAELLIHKPFNEIEVRNVLHNMEMSRAMQGMIFPPGHFHGNQMCGYERCSPRNWKQIITSPYGA